MSATRACESNESLSPAAGGPGGVNLVLADGSVHFILNTIDPATWRALSTRGEAVVGDYCGCR